MSSQSFKKSVSKTQINSKQSLKAVSLFAGGGGLDLGMEAVGFDTVFATDIDEHSCKTLKMGKLNAARLKKPFLQDALIVQRDINELQPEEILQETGLQVGELDILVGGPPCQAYSVFGKRKGREDPRGRLFFEYLKMLSGLRPKAFLFENVYGLLTVEKGLVFKEICEKLSNPDNGLEYKLSIFRLNAVDYCVPQFRDRVFIIGHIDGKSIDEIPILCSNNPSSLSNKNSLQWRTVENALKGLPELEDPKIANHIGRKHSQRIIDRYGSMSPGDRDKHTRINKLDLKRPSYTIIVGSDKGGGKGHIHPIDAREVTPRESARIQTFPDWWEFSGTSRHPIRQVGNAVPPLLAARIGNEIRSQLFNKKQVPWNKIVDLLDQQHLFD